MKQHLIIGIAGGSGSGKTTLAENIARHFGNEVSVIRHDNYYKAQPNLSYEQRAQMNYDHPSAFDSELLLRHLDALKAGQAVDGPVYDYAQHDRSTETVRIESTDVIILAGILIFENADILKRLDMKIYVDTDADVRIVRRILRDVEQRGRSLESVISQYLATVKPMHEKYVEPSKHEANIIVPDGGENVIAAEMIISYIREQLFL